MYFKRVLPEGSGHVRKVMQRLRKVTQSEASTRIALRDFA